MIIAQTMRIERKFPVQVEALFHAFVDPKQIAQWYGPEGTTISGVKAKVEDGGHLKLDRKGDADQGEWAGYECPVCQEFSTVVSNELIEATETMPGPGGVNFTTNLKLVFETTKNGSKLIIEQSPISADMVEMNKFGWNSSLNRLEKLLDAAV